MELISIIVPVYNIQDYLPRCLDSILEQTYENLEIILIDDGSKDDSGKICDDYAERDKRIKVIHKENGGVSSARNAGLDAATGDCIGFIDGDDLIEPDMYSILIQNMKTHNVDISVCQMDTVSVDGKIEQTYSFQSQKLKIEDVVDGFFFDEFIKAIMYSQCNKIYKRSIIEGSYYRPYKYGEDILFVFESLMKSTSIYYDNRVGYHYIHRVESAMTSSFSVKRLDYVYAAQEVVLLCKQFYPDLASNAELWLYQHMLITLRQVVLLEDQRGFAEYITMSKRYLKENKRYLSRLPLKRRLDYFGIMYCNAYLHLLMKMKKK